MVSFNTYQPPGVYVEGAPATLVTAGGTPATTVTLVGSARGYQLATETFPLTGTARALANRGVLPDSHPSPNLAVSTLGGAALAEDVDYALVRGSLASDATTIARINTSTVVADGEQVVVSYSFADADYYAPKTFEDSSSVEKVYGPALVSSLPSDPDETQVASPLTLAASLAFQNGASSVLLVAVEPTTVDINLRTRFTEAYQKLGTNPEVTLLVPVLAQPAGQDNPTYTSSVAAFVSDARAHCVDSADDGYGRIAFVGVDTGYDDSDVTFEEMAAAVDSNRVVIAYPSRLRLYNASLSQTTEVGGCYLAAAYAGRLAAQDPSRGLTRLQVYGFSGLPTDVVRDMTTAFKNSLSSSGVAVTEVGRTGALQVRHGTSSDPTDILTREISVMRAQDVLYRIIADGIEGADLIGSPIDADVLIQVKGILTGLLESATADSVIAEWLDLQVRQQSTPEGNPTIVEAQFTYKPFLPLNYIVVTFAMDLTTGNSTTTVETVAA